MSAAVSVPSASPSLRSADEVYATAGALLERVVAGAGFREALSNIDALVCFRVFAPSASLALDCRTGRVPSLVLDAPANAESTLIVLEADALHALLLGQVNPARALRAGEIVVQGPRRDAIQRILPLFGRVLAPLYIDQLREMNRIDLVPEPLRPPTPEIVTHP